MNGIKGDRGNTGYTGATGATGATGYTGSINRPQLGVQTVSYSLPGDSGTTVQVDTGVSNAQSIWFVGWSPSDSFSSNTGAYLAEIYFNSTGTTWNINATVYTLETSGTLNYYLYYLYV